MSRLSRLHVPGACYYVVLRGNRGQRMFAKAADRQLLERFVADAGISCSVSILAYCWLVDRIELLVKVSHIPLGRFMQRIGTRYARAMLKRSATTGRRSAATTRSNRSGAGRCTMASSRERRPRS